MSEYIDLETGEKVQDSADPESITRALSENMDTAFNSESATEDDEAGEDTASAGDAASEKNEAQSAEERRRFAAIRREQEAKENRRLEQLRVDKAYADAFKGQTNPYTGKPIASQADFEEFQSAHKEECAKNQLKSTGIPFDALSGVIENHPTVTKMNEFLRRADLLEKEMKAEKAKEGIENELKIIRSLDPSLKTLEDLKNMPGADKFLEIVKRGGVTLSDAYKLVNFDALTARKASAAKQSAINRLAGKGHLAPTSQRGEGGITIPPETLQYYREIMPGKTDADYEKHYARHVK